MRVSPSAHKVHPVQNPRSPFAFGTGRRRLVHFLFCAFVTLQPITVLGQRQNPSRSATVTVNFNPGHPANRFTPAHALGAAVDGHDKRSEEHTSELQSLTNLVWRLLLEKKITES